MSVKPKPASTPTAVSTPPNLAETAQLQEKMLAMNEALMLGAVRQHELTEAAGAANAQLQMEIGERKKAEASLREAAERKNEFLALLAHELRGPLAPLSNALEIMQRTDGNSENALEARAIAVRQVEHMVRLIDDLLDVSRISRGNLTLRRQRMELASVMHHALETCRPAMDLAQHQLKVTLPPEPIYLNADPVRLAQIFSNLLTNACKYTEPGGRISISAEQQGGEVLVSVKDNGIGIAPDMLPKIFEMFVQVDKALERTQGGLGIGLSLVQRLVAMHGGTVEARSEGAGKGSEFIVRLPLVEGVRKEMGAEKSAADSFSIRDERREAKHSILVVDDNRDSAITLAMILKVDGHQTHTAFDGLEAVAAASRLRPEVVLLDLGLPGMNGFEAARKIRAEPWGKTMLLIALTGWGQDEDRRKSKEAGFDAHLVKPVDFDALTKLLGGFPVAGSLH